jgi:hypothetical protein
MAEQGVEDLFRRLTEGLPSAVRGLGADVEANLRALLRANLTKLDLVARDEFDAQARLLARTRARLDALEQRLAGLEAARPPDAR